MKRALFLLLFLVDSGSIGIAAAQENQQISWAVTTGRLNLRTCPKASSDCRVIRTLVPGTRLEIVGSEREWLLVSVIADGTRGWVHADYTRSIPTPPMHVSEKVPAGKAPFSNWKLWIILLGTVMFLTYLGPKIQPNITHDKMLITVVSSLVIGTAVLLNQFGPLIIRHLTPYQDLSSLSILWEVNFLTVSAIDYQRILLFLLLIAALTALFLPAAHGEQQSFLQGFGTGIILLPAISASLSIIGVAGWAIFQILKLLWIILGYISIPFEWLFANIISPLFKLISRPFIWIWDNLLEGVILFLATPFVWFWEVVLSPVSKFLLKYIFKPVMFLGLAVLVSSFVLLPVSLAGLAIIESVRSSFKGAAVRSLDSFSQGMALGLLAFDAIILLSLNHLGILESNPPVSVMVAAAISALGVIRLLLTSRSLQTADASLTFRKKLTWYWETSRWSLLSACVLLPIGIVFFMVFSDEGEA